MTIYIAQIKNKKVAPLAKSEINALVRTRNTLTAIPLMALPKLTAEMFVELTTFLNNYTIQCDNIICITGSPCIVHSK